MGWNIYSQCLTFCIIIYFLNRVITFGIFFSIVVRAAVKSKLVILGILSSVSSTLALKSVLLISLPGSINYLVNSLNTVFLTTLLSTTLLNFFKSTGTSFNLLTSNLSTLLFKLSKPLSTFFYLINIQFINLKF